jgi:uncharacterized protein (DUF58 family)
MSAHAIGAHAVAEERTARISRNARRIEIGARRLAASNVQGGVQSRIRGRGMDFDELREYAPGDNVRSIDWNASARTGRTFVRRYREERQLTVVFVVDMSASGALGAGDATKRDQAVEIAGVLTLAALHSDHRVGLMLFTDSVERYVPPGRGRRHALQLVRDLLEFEPKGRATRLSAALEVLRRRLTRRAVIVVVSDFIVSPDDLTQTGRELSGLARRHDIVCVRTGDRHDRELPAVGLLTIEDVETGEIVEIDTASAVQRAALAKAIGKTEARLHTMLRGARADLLEVDTLLPYLGPLIGFFKSHRARS